MIKPNVAELSHNERESLLSSIGNFPPAERDMFHTIALAWQPQIPYQHTIALTSGHYSNSADRILGALMGKLRAHRYGLIRTVIKNGTRINDHIILADQDSFAFYKGLTDEYFVTMMESPQNPCPLLSTVKKEFAKIPSKIFTFVTSSDVGEYMLQEAENIICAIPYTNDEAIIITPSNLQTAAYQAILRLKAVLSTPQALETIAKLQNTTLSSIKEGIHNSNAKFWDSICNILLKHKEDIMRTRSINLSDSSFHELLLLITSIRARLFFEKQQKTETQFVESQLQKIERAILMSPNKWVEHEQIIALIDKATTENPKISDRLHNDFFELYATKKYNQLIPIIFKLKNKYIHRLNMYTFFQQQQAYFEHSLHSYFIENIKRNITNKNNPQFIMPNIDTFPEMINDYLIEHSDYMGHIIKNPAILAEIMILYIKEKRIAQTSEEIKKYLSLYFDANTKKPLPINRWFNLELGTLFREALRSCSIMQKLWILITGKYHEIRTSTTTTEQNTKAKMPFVQKEKTQAEKNPQSETVPSKVKQQNIKRQTIIQAAKDQIVTLQKHEETKQPARKKIIPSHQKKRKTQGEKRLPHKNDIEAAWEDFKGVIQQQENENTDI